MIYESELYHHGILGQKWGKRNGPPYPLNDSDHSTSEKKSERPGGGSIGKEKTQKLYSESSTYRKYLNEDGTMTNLGKKKFGDFNGSTPVDQMMNDYKNGKLKDSFVDSVKYVQKYENKSLSDSLKTVEKDWTDMSNRQKISFVEEAVKKEDQNTTFVLMTVVPLGAAIVSGVLSGSIKRILNK